MVNARARAIRVPEHTLPFSSHPKSMRVDLVVLDFIDQKETVVAGILRWSERRFWRQRLEAEEQKCSHQIRAIHAIFAHAQYHGVDVQFLFGKLQQRDEWLLGGLWQENGRQGDVQNVVLWIENGVPNAERDLGDVQFECDANRFLLVRDAFDDVVAIVFGHWNGVTRFAQRRRAGDIIVGFGKINVGELWWTGWV